MAILRCIHRLLLVVPALVCGAASAGSPGTLDPTYGTEQGLTPFWIQGHNYALKMLPMADGGWVVSGTMQRQVGKTHELIPTLVRYRADGALDEAFGQRGSVTTPLKFNTQPPGAYLAGDSQRIYMVVADEDYVYVAAYHSNGALDVSFGDGGVSKVSIGQNAYSVFGVIMQNGKVLIVGSGSTAPFSHSSFLLIRLTPSGQLDSTFAGGGKLLTSLDNGSSPFVWQHFSSVALAPDGKIVAQGFAGDTLYGMRRVVAKYGENGQLDKSFGTGGFRTIAMLDYEHYFDNDVAVLPDGKIIASGSTCATVGPTHSTDLCYVAVARLLPDGNFDNGFGVGGKVVQEGPGADRSLAETVAVDAQGRIVVGGRSSQDNVVDGSRAYVLRLNQDGSLDRSFGSGGMVAAVYGDAFSTITDMAVVYPVPSRPFLFTIGYRKTGAVTTESVIARHTYTEDVPAAIAK